MSGPYSKQFSSLFPQSVMFNDEIRARAYAQVLSDYRYGVPLWDPLGSDQVAIGDVGYVQAGRYHKFLTGAVPDTRQNPWSRDKTKRRSHIVSEKQGLHSPEPSEPVLYPRVIVSTCLGYSKGMLWRFQYSLPREVNHGGSTKFCTVEAGLSLVAAPDWGYTNNHNTFAKIACENAREWLDYADRKLPQSVVEDGIIFVTGFLRGNRDWDMYCSIRDHPALGTCESLRAGCNCELPKFRHNVGCTNSHPDANVFNQPLFLGYNKMKRRPRGTTFIAPRQRRQVPQLKAHAQHSSRGYVQLSEGDVEDEDEDECDTETLFKHPVDWTLDYIFETSPEAEIAYVSDRQIFKICNTCDTEPLIQQVVVGDIRGKEWKTNNFYFYLQYHRPKVLIVDGVATLDTSSESLFSFLCALPLYKPLRTMYVYTQVRERLPRSILKHPPATSFLKIKVVSPAIDESSEQCEKSSEQFEKSSEQFEKSSEQEEMREKSSGPILHFDKYNTE